MRACPLSSSYFFFERYGDHRDLHSFPTRRSSDLVGVADTPLRQGVLDEDGTVLQIQARAAKAALDEAGLSFDDVDGLFAAGAWGVPGPGLFMPATLAEYLGIRPGYLDGTQIGGSSFEAHVGHAAAAVGQGVCEVALILYGSRQRSDASRTLGARGPAVLNSQYEAPFGLPSPVGAYAMAAMRHRHVHGTTAEQLRSEEHTSELQSRSDLVCRLLLEKKKK